MTPPIYLRRIACENFRVFGRAFALDLPGPGATIITGANGLGKSSLLDAIEWGLTGVVTRLSKAPGYDAASPLLRRDGSHSGPTVKLTFDPENSVIERKARGGTAADVVRLLRHPDWTAEITDLGPHLRLTHFLGQNAQTRLLFRPEEDQWKEIHSATGLPYFNLIRARLGDGTTRGFTSIIGNLEQDIERLKEAIHNLHSGTQRRDTLISEAQAGLPATPEMVGERCRAMLAAIAPVIGDAAEVPDAPGERMTFVAGRLDEARAAIAQRLASLRTGDGLVDGRRAVERNLAEAMARVATIETALTERQARHIEMLGQRALLAKTAEALRQQLATEQAGLERWQEVAAAAAGWRRATAALAARDTDIVTLRGQEATAQQQISDARQGLARRQVLDGQREDIGQAMVRTTARLEEWAACQEQQRLTAAEAPHENDLKQRLDTAEATVARLDTDRTAAAGRLADIQGQVRVAERDAEELGGLIAALAAHIEHDTPKCPLCLTPFVAGKLREQVDLAIGKADEVLAALRQAEASCRKDHDAIAAALEMARRQQSAVTQALAELRQRRSAAQQRIDALLRSMPGASGLEEAGATLRDDVAALRQQDAATTLEQASLATLEALAATVRIAQEQLLALTQRLKEALAGRDRAAADRDACLQVFQKHQMPPPEGETDNFAAALAAAQATLGKADIRHSEARRRLASHNDLIQDIRQTVAAAEADLQAGRSVRDGLVSELATLGELWKGLALAGNPDAATLRSAIAEAESSETRLAVLAEQLENLRQDHHRWLAAGKIKDIEDQLASHCAAVGVATVDEAVADLEKKLADVQAKFKTAQRARRLAGTLSTRMRTEITAFEDNILDPLNDRFLAFSRALSTSGDLVPDVSSRSHMRKKGVWWGVKVLRDGADGGASVPAHQRLSEGQLASLALSFLMAASTTHRWSRWPALILDDPLQHNDLVHLAAFTDLIRRLIQEKGYQVILSTHDQAEADYLFRRLHSVGDGATLCTLLGTGSDGVECRIRHRP